MELLILSKLKWDLTAITSYDYLDYMINSTISKSTKETIQSPSGCSQMLIERENSKLEIERENSKLQATVRRNTEKLVTLCATDETFMSMPPSLVAASALVTAIEQDASVTNNFNLNQIVTNIRNLTNLEIVSTHNFPLCTSLFKFLIDVNLKVC